MLVVEGLSAGYGKKQVLHGITLSVSDGEIVALVGPNGAGKSTVLRAAYGLVEVWKGRALLDGIPLNGLRPDELIERGVVYVPQGRWGFAELTVLDNLRLGAPTVTRAELPGRMDEVLAIFPVLKERLQREAGTLSGGERQMLCLARGLMARPRLLLLDEPSVGLAPGRIEFLFDLIARINQERSVSMLIVEQRVREVLAVSSRVYALRLGCVAYEGLSAELLSDHDRIRQLFV
jgi:branched-chain amino acid transport system ATP-binding protein